MAKRYWPGTRTRFGKTFNTNGADGKAFEVVGVAADHKVATIGESPTPFIHVARAQQPNSYNIVIARTRGDAGALLRDMRRELLALEPHLVFVENQTMEAEVAATLYLVRASAWLLGVVGIVAMALAAIGLYGVIAYSVAQRTREIGIRVALGAAPASVLRALIMRQGLRVAAVGLGVRQPRRRRSRMADRERALRHQRRRPRVVGRRCCCAARRLGAGEPHPGAAGGARRSLGGACESNRAPRHLAPSTRELSTNSSISSQEFHVQRSSASACRLLWKDKSFTVTAALTLAVCIGANAALFSVVHNVLLRPLGVSESDRILVMENIYPKAGADTGARGRAGLLTIGCARRASTRSRRSSTSGNVKRRSERIRLDARSA